MYVGVGGRGCSAIKVDARTVGMMTSGLCLGSGLALFADLTVSGNFSARDSLVRILFAGMNQ
jgi:hypothetical protein